MVSVLNEFPSFFSIQNCLSKQIPTLRLYKNTSYFSVDDKPRMKRFTPPRNARGSQSESDYSDSDSDSYYSSSYT